MVTEIGNVIMNVQVSGKGTVTESGGLKVMQLASLLHAEPQVKKILPQLAETFELAGIVIDRRVIS